MKIATVKLGWERSVSADVTSRVVTITKDGETTTIDVGPEVSEYVLEVEALKSVAFNTTVFDSEGNETTMETYSFTLGDLTPPQPDTNPFHEVLSVRDDEVPAPTE